jgi:hypothetical protein
VRLSGARLLVGVFDDFAEIHDRDAVADVLDDSEIVRDEQIRKVLFALQIHHQIDDLSLDRHVERRDRLVADDQRSLYAPINRATPLSDLCLRT